MVRPPARLPTPFLVVFALLTAAAGLHAIALMGAADRRRQLRFPPLPPEAVPLPPLPFFEDLVALADFLLTSADDVAEDAAKLTCVAASYAAGWSLIGGRHFPLARATGYAAALALYLPCDAISDRAGDLVGGGLVGLARLLGYARPGRIDTRAAAA
jgi:hypothetical protein